MFILHDRGKGSLSIFHDLDSYEIEMFELEIGIIEIEIKFLMIGIRSGLIENRISL